MVVSYQQWYRYVEMGVGAKLEDGSNLFVPSCDSSLLLKIAPGTPATFELATDPVFCKSRKPEVRVNKTCSAFLCLMTWWTYNATVKGELTGTSDGTTTQTCEWSFFFVSAVE